MGTPVTVTLPTFDPAVTMRVTVWLNHAILQEYHGEHFRRSTVMPVRQREV